jgi:hypothetical protein
MQGYRFGKPLTADAITERLRNEQAGSAIGTPSVA